ncbi:MAG: MBL fold metallo-hydrolase [Gemmatimonadaceae bacterium]|nr:MBL fold metallo-hydrolase [Gemmatimonadaceae bacterium]
MTHRALHATKRLLGGALLASLFAAVPPAANAASRTLDIYFIDVEGGQATLIVTPAGESLLIDAGFPNEGTFASKPGDPTEARDPQRILAAAHDAGINRIDYLMITHFHGDHVGGVVELSQLLPIRAFIDHEAPLPEAEAAVSGTQLLYNAYLTRRARATHLQPKPGDRLPLKGIDAIIVSAAGQTLTSPLKGAGAVNASCAGTGLPAQEHTENPRSTGVRLAFGKFRFLDVGDLTGPPLFALTCPRNLVGESDVYLVAHHGGLDAADAAMFKAVNPLVAVINNGPLKGGSAQTMATLHQLPAIDTWQLHRSLMPGVLNMPDARVVNVDESTSAWIKLSAKADGSFTVTNGRTGDTKAYHR